MEDALAQWPEKWIDLPLAVIDVETTGFDPEDPVYTHTALLVGALHHVVRMR